MLSVPQKYQKNLIGVRAIELSIERIAKWMRSKTDPLYMVVSYV